MSNETLGLKIQASLNFGLSLKNINSELLALSKHPSLQKLKVNITIDENFIKNLSSFTKNLNTITQQLNQQYNANAKLNSGLNDTTQTIQNQTKATNEAIAAEKKWRLVRESVNKAGMTTAKYANGSKTQTVTTMPDGGIKNIVNATDYDMQYKTIEALDRAHYNALKDNKAKIETMDKLHYLALQKNRELDWKNLQAANNQAEALDKAHFQALKINDDKILASKQKTQSLINSAYSGKQTVNSTTSGINETKALELLNRQYSKVLENLNAYKASGKQLTESEIAGFNRRIQSLNNLAVRQKKQEADQAQLLSAQIRAEAQVNNLISKYGSNIDTTKLHQLLAELKALDTTVANFKGKSKQLTNEIDQIGKAARSSTEQTHKMGLSLKQVVTNMAMYAGIGSVFYGAINALKEMTRVIVQVDQEMTQLKRVMDDDTDFDNMLSNSIELANELGRSISEVNQNMIGFARMGFDESQTAALAETATLFQNISDLTPDEAVDTLTAAMTVFNVEAGKSIEVANKINEVDNNFAVSSQNIALGITKAGSAAKTFGVTMEELVGNLTAISTASRESGSIVGNSLKTIYSRLTTMPKSESLLSAAGVQMRELNGEVRDASDILNDLAGKWNGLSKEQQQNTAVGLAGRYQLSRFLALMSNWQISLNATETALYSQGSAVSENEKYMQSLDARIQKMRTSWDTLALSVGDSLISDSIVVLTSLMTVLGSILTKTVDTFGALPVIFGASYVALMLLNTGFKLFVVNLASSVAGLFGVTAAAGGTRLGLLGISAAAKIAGISLKSLLITSGIGIAFIGLGWALEKVIGHFSKTSEVVDETASSLEKLNNTTGNLKELQDLSNKYDSLAKKTNLTTEEKIRLASVESDLATKHGIVMKTVEDQTDAVKANTTAIKEKITALKEEAAEEQKKALDEYKANKTAINSQIEKQKASKTAAEEEINNLSRIQKHLEESIANKEVIKNDKGQLGNFASHLLEINPEDYDASGLDDISEAIAQAILDAKSNFEAAGTEFDKAVSKREQAFKAQFSSYADTVEAGGVEVKASTRVLADGYASIMATTNTDDLVILEKYKNEVFNIFQNTKVNSMDDAIKALESFSSTSRLTKDQINILQTAISQLNFQGIDEGADGAADSLDGTEDKVLTLSEAMGILGKALNGSATDMEKFYESLAKGRDEISLLISAQEEMEEQGYLSIHTLQQLSSTFDDFSSHIGDSKDQLLNYISTKETDRISTIQAERDKTKALIEATYLRIEAMQTEMEAVEKLQNTYGDAVDSGAMSDLEAERRIGTRRKMSSGASVTEELRRINELTDKLKLLNYAEKDYKAATAGSKDDKKEDTKKGKEDKVAEDLAELKDATASRIAALNALAVAQAKTNETLSAASSSAESNKSYAEAIKQQTALINGQTVAINHLSDANKSLYGDKKALQNANKGYDMSTWIGSDGEASQAFDKLYNSQSTGTAQKNLQALFDKYKMLTDAIAENNETIRTTTANQVASTTNLREQYFTQSEYFIETESEKMRQAGKSELQIAQFVMESRKRMASEKWTTERKIAKLSADEQIAAEKAVLEAVEDYNQKRLDVIKDRITKIDNMLTASSAKLSKLEENLTNKLNGSYNPGSLSAYNSELATNINLLQQKQAQEILTETELRKQMNAVGITKEKYEDLNSQLIASVQNQIDLVTAIGDTSKKIIEQQQQMADDIVSIIKEGYEKQKEIALENIDKQIEAIEDEADAFEKAQDAKIDALDEEIQKLEEVYSARIKLIDDQESEDDYQKKLTKAQDEAQKTRDQIAVLSRSDDIADKARRKDLEEKLAEQLEDIAEMQHDREIDLRKESLQIELDAQKTELEKEKTTEQEKVDANQKSVDAQKKLLEDLKKTQETYYDNLINDERTFYQLKQEIMAGNYTNATAQLEALKVFYQANTASIGTSITNNLVDKIGLMQTRVSEAASTMNANFLSISNNIQNTLIATLNTLIEKMTELSKISLNNVISSSGTTTGTVLDSKLADKMNAEKDAVITTPVLEQIQEAVKKRRWDGEKWVYYHTGGDVGDEPLKNGEVPAILEEGETVLTKAHQGLLSKILSMSPLGDMLSRFTPSLPNLSGLSNSTTRSEEKTGNTYHLNVTFPNKYVGTEKQSKEVVNWMIKEGNKLGMDW